VTTVYLDESGDLGFDLDKPGTSRSFLVTIIVCEDPDRMDKLVTKVFRGFSKTQVKHHHGVLHAYTEDPPTRRKLLGWLAQEPVSILVIHLDKTRVYTKMSEEKHLLYNYVVNILLGRLADHHLVRPGEPVRVVASQRETSPFLNANFAAYLTSNAVDEHGIDLVVEIKPASAEKGLQVVDCVSWGLYRKYESGDSSYADIIAGRIIEESSIYG